MVVLEVVDVAEVAQFFEVADDEVVHVFEFAGLSQQEDGSVGELPGFFGACETVVHAATASLELGCE